MCSSDLTHLGWAARILGFYAKTPVFQGANEREIGLLLRLAGLKWVRGALRLKVDAPDPSDRDVKAILADVRPKVGVADKVELLADATLDDLGSRAMSQESRDVYHGVRDYIAAAARELAERELEAASHAVAFNTAAAEGDDFAASRKAELKKAGKELEKRAATDPADQIGRAHV